MQPVASWPSVARITPKPRTRGAKRASGGTCGHGRTPVVTDALVACPAPRTPVYRIGYPPDPFAPTPWLYARPDGSFGSRFDDAAARRGVPRDQQFRVLYLASQSAGAFAEALAGLRPHPALLTHAGITAPQSRLARPVVSAQWRAARRIGATLLHPRLPFADIVAPETVQALREALSSVAVALGLNDIDLSSLSGPQRLFTQEVARFIYDVHDDAGTPCYAGIRYLSRLNLGWECWAVFSDRLLHQVIQVETIAADNPGLFDAARILKLSIEDDRGGLIAP